MEEELARLGKVSPTKTPGTNDKLDNNFPASNHMTKKSSQYQHALAQNKSKTMEIDIEGG